MNSTSGLGMDVSGELLTLEGDPRLARRSQKLLEKWQQKPELGFPKVFGESELEALYRFLRNPSVEFDKLLEAQATQTVARCEGFDEVLCLHDTSTFIFNGEREGLGYINKNNRGFLAHVALVTSWTKDDVPIPLGVVAASTWVRSEPRRTKVVPQHKLRQSDDCESHRWLSTMQEAQQRLGRGAVHVMDREGDIYDCISTMVADDIQFVVRAKSNRIIDSDDSEYHLLFDALDGLAVRYSETVPVAARKASKLPDQKTAYPAREGRRADVHVTATEVTIRRTRNSSNLFPPTTTLNLVHVFEPNPPPEQRAVEWVLLTNKPISTNEEIRKIVECYRQRWLIEEFFKAIKTGCAYEKRQLETYHSLTNALAMAFPIAWNMLLLRTQSRTDQSEPAEKFISPLRLRVIRAHPGHYKLPEHPTLKDVAYAIAGMGGHLKRNGPPGWHTLRDGFERLLTLEEGWLMSMKTCDQS